MTTPPIRRAQPGDAATVAGIIAEAFEELELSQWLVPDPTTRRRILAGNFTLFVEHAITYGTVYLTEDHTAAAVWLPSAGVPDIPDFERRNKEACGDRVSYFDALGECFDNNHPHHAAHHYLQFLGVIPGSRDQRIGSAMMDTHHAITDAHGMPAYLEASNENSHRMYLRHGYHDLGEPIRPADDAPCLYPMWRNATS